MKDCRQNERIAVCLYFMSDLPIELHTHAAIEQNLRLIFPPSQGKGYMPDDYTDFQAAVQRSYFDLESKRCREGKLHESQRLWRQPYLGRWENTAVGNELALKVLRSKGIIITQQMAYTPLAIDIAEPGPVSRTKTEIYRILRDTTLARHLKETHQNKCQLCGCAIEIGNTIQYSEAHHIKPLGTPHNGPDIAGNILVLCPNHHVLLDYGAMALDISQLREAGDHKVSKEFVDYHNQKVFGATY